MAGLDARQLLEQVIRPALKPLGTTNATISAEQIVLGTGVIESNLTWLKQHGSGPALSLWQMEPITFFDIINRMLALDRPKMIQVRNGVWSLAINRPPKLEELPGNLFLGAALCRVKYMMDRQPLPAPGDIVGLATTWKRCYNTPEGAGKVDDFIRKWHDIIQPRYDEMWPV